MINSLAALAMLAGFLASMPAPAAASDFQRPALSTSLGSPSARHSANELPAAVVVGDGWSESSVTTPLCYQGHVTDKPVPRSVRYRLEFKNSDDSMTVRATATIVDYRTSIADVKLIGALRHLQTIQVWNLCGEQYVGTAEYGAQLTEEFIFSHPPDDENFTPDRVKTTFRDLELVTVPGAHAARDVEFAKAFTQLALILGDYPIVSTDVHATGALPHDRVYGDYFEDRLEPRVFEHYAGTVPKQSRGASPLVSFVTTPMPISVVQRKNR